MQVKIKERSWLAALAAKKLGTDKLAMVLGRTIHLTGASREEFLKDREWVCHELVHVAQYRRYGKTGFLCRYLFESFRRGYQQNRFEEEARKNENNAALLHQVEFS